MVCNYNSIKLCVGGGESETEKETENLQISVTVLAPAILSSSILYAWPEVMSVLRGSMPPFLPTSMLSYVLQNFKPAAIPSATYILLDHYH